MTPDDHLVVPWHEKDEAYIFSSSGEHLETRSLFSDTTLLRLTYNDQGRLEQVTTKKQSILKIDSHHLLLNNRKVAVIRAANSQGLLSSVMTSSGMYYQINYDHLDRVRQMVENGKFVTDFNYAANGDFLFSVK